MDILHEYLKSHPAYQYALDVVSGDSVANEDMKIVCRDFIDEVNNPESKYYFDEKLLRKTTNLFKLINMPDGVQINQPVSESLAGFQWFFMANTLCWKMARKKDLRRYEKSIMLIGRKNGKISPF